MNTLIVTASIVLAASGATHQPYGQEFRWEPNAKSTLTRAEVKADLLKAIKDGTHVLREGDRFEPVVVSKRSREEVRAEAVEVRQPSPFIDIFGN